MEQCWQFLSEAQKTKPRLEKDLRKVLAMKDVDAVIIATPDNWHAPATILACQAGKDVYVEKPHSHNIWESGQMVKAAAKYQRIVQVGTQNRSGEYNHAAREIIKSGKLGQIGLIKVFNMKSGERFNLGQPGQQPAGFDWDRWLGRAPLRPYHEALFKGGWHYFWEYCGGDMADDGIHQLDLGLMLMGDPGLPRSVRALGGRYVHKGDDAQVPDVELVNWDFGSFAMTFEQTQYPKYMVKSTDTIRRKDLVPNWAQNATRIEIYGSELMMLLGRHGGGWIIEQSGGRILEKMYGQAGDYEHYKNFLACVKSRKKPNADISIAHASNITMHMGNLAHRVGNVAMNYDPERGRFDNEQANRMIKEEYRKGYEIPEEV
jgi:predicted dehydrogenase